MQPTLTTPAPRIYPAQRPQPSRAPGGAPTRTCRAHPGPPHAAPAAADHSASARRPRCATCAAGPPPAAAAPHDLRPHGEPGHRSHASRPQPSLGGLLRPVVRPEEPLEHHGQLRVAALEQPHPGRSRELSCFSSDDPCCLAAWAWPLATHLTPGRAFRHATAAAVKRMSQTHPPSSAADSSPPPISAHLAAATARRGQSAGGRPQPPGISPKMRSWTSS